ncbi:MAG: mechanosensitive ion channel family protein, partial [Methylophaga sp.]
MELSSFSELWSLVLVVWNEGLYGIDIAHILLALMIFLLFLTIRNLFSRYALGAISRVVKKTAIDNEVFDSLYAPLRFVPVVMGVFFATSILRLEEGTAAFLYNVNRSLVAYTIFWAFYSLSSPMGMLLKNVAAGLTTAMVEWIIKICRIAFVVLGAATILELWGIAVGPVIAGLGLFGIALALGAQDLFKNLIAGLFVLGERRFHVGDWINVEGVVEGTVMQIGFRTTTVRRFDRAPVYVPNASLANNATTNFSRMSHRRIRWMLGVEYRTTLEQLREIRDGIEKYILESDEF